MGPKERERESQADFLWALSPHWRAEIMTWAESKSWMLHWLSPPGAPFFPFWIKLLLFSFYVGGDYQKQCPYTRAWCLSFLPMPKTVIYFYLCIGNQPSETLLLNLTYCRGLLTVPLEIISLLIFLKSRSNHVTSLLKTLLRLYISWDIEATILILHPCLYNLVHPCTTSSSPPPPLPFFLL